MGTPTIRAGTVPPRRGSPGQLRVHTLTLETPLSRTTIFFAASFSLVARAQSKRWIWAAVAFLGTWPGIAFADSATVAVSSNFAATARGLVEVFEAQNIHEIRVATGSSGKLYAQIQNGAPFDVFLSADMARPEQLVAESVALVRNASGLCPWETSFVAAEGAGSWRALRAGLVPGTRMAEQKTGLAMWPSRTRN